MRPPVNHIARLDQQRGERVGAPGHDQGEQHPDAVLLPEERRPDVQAGEGKDERVRVVQSVKHFLVVESVLAGSDLVAMLPSRHVRDTGKMQACAPPILDAQLRLLAAIPRQELTFTCVPPGSGQRLGLDRDADGVLDADEGG